jgi:hypothetical protein
MAPYDDDVHPTTMTVCTRQRWRRAPTTMAACTQQQRRRAPNNNGGTHPTTMVTCTQQQRRRTPNNNDNGDGLHLMMMMAMGPAAEVDNGWIGWIVLVILYNLLFCKIR